MGVGVCGRVCRVEVGWVVVGSGAGVSSTLSPASGAGQAGRGGRGRRRRRRKSVERTNERAQPAPAAAATKPAQRGIAQPRFVTAAATAQPIASRRRSLVHVQDCCVRTGIYTYRYLHILLAMSQSVRRRAAHARRPNSIQFTNTPPSRS